MCDYTRRWHAIRLGEPAQAIPPLQRSVDLTRRHGNRRDLGWDLRPLATAHLLLGQHNEAGRHIAGALEIFDDLGDRTGPVTDVLPARPR